MVRPRHRCVLPQRRHHTNRMRSKAYYLVVLYSCRTFTVFRVFLAVMSSWFDFVLVATGLVVLFGVIAWQHVL